MIAWKDTCLAAIQSEPMKLCLLVNVFLQRDDIVR